MSNGTDRYQLYWVNGEISYVEGEGKDAETAIRRKYGSEKMAAIDFYQTVGSNFNRRYIFKPSELVEGTGVWVEQDS